MVNIKQRGEISGVVTEGLTLRGVAVESLVLRGVVTKELELKGTISKKIEAVERHEKAVTIEENGTFEILPDDGNVLGKVTVTARVPGGKGDVVEYEGDYEVTPKFEAQTLETASKVMLDDVTVKEIALTVVSNESGGNTIVIGS